MVKGTLFCVLLALTNVQSFHYIGNIRSTVSAQQSQSSARFPVRSNAEGIKLSQVAVELSSKKSATGVIQRSFQLFLQSSLEKRLVVAAYPLTIVLIYFLFTSTFVVTSLRNILRSVDKSINKTRLKVSALATSFAKAKKEDETLIQKYMELDAARKEVLESSQLAEETAIAVAKEDVKVKIEMILQDEMRAKSLKADKAAKLDETVSISAIKDTGDLVIDVVNTEEVFVSLAPPSVVNEALAIEEMIDVAVLQVTNIEIPFNALRSAKKSTTEDATIAMFVILFVGSPFLHVIQQHMASI